MNTEYEEFENIEDLFSFLSVVAVPMKNTMAINSYKDHILSLIPLGSTGDAYLMVFTKGTLEPGIYEFDINTKSHKKVDAIERADKSYFVCITPKRHTLADVALEKI